MSGSLLQRMVCLAWPTLALALVGTVLAASSRQGQAPAVFAAQCAACHGENGLGTAQGPALAMNQRVAEQSAEQLAGYLQRGNVAAGMPSFANLDADDRMTLARYLLRLNVDTILKPPVAPNAENPLIGRERRCDSRV